MPKSSPLSLRLPPELLEEIRKEARRTSRSASQIIESTLEEGVRMRRCPGIIFAHGPAGRRAIVAGTGIDVWEVVRIFVACDENVDALRRALPQLSLPQLEAALFYYHSYPHEIDERLKLEEEAFDEFPALPFVRKIRI